MLKERNRFVPSAHIEDVNYGCVVPVDEQGLNIGRIAPMVAGWDDDVPGVQRNRLCGFGQQVINFMVRWIRGGMHVVLIGGGEHDIAP